MNINFNFDDNNNIYGNNLNKTGYNMFKISTEEGNELIRKCVEGKNKNNISSSEISIGNNIINQSIISKKNNILDESEMSIQQKYTGPKGQVLLEGIKGVELFDKVNYVISIYKDVMDVIQRLVNYIRQVEFTTEAIKGQINKNYNKYSQKIFDDLNNIYSTIGPNMDKFKSKYKKLSTKVLNYSYDFMLSNNKEGDNSFSSNIINIPNENDNDNKKIIRKFLIFVL